MSLKEHRRPHFGPPGSPEEPGAQSPRAMVARAQARGRMDKMPEYLRASMPDFNGWRMRIFITLLAISCGMLIAEVIVIVIKLINADTIDVASLVVLPAVIFAALGIEALVLRKAPEIIPLKNFSILACFVIICTAIASSNYTPANTMMLNCIPIMTSIAFYSNALSAVTTVFSMIGVVVSVIITVGEGNTDGLVASTVAAGASIVFSFLITQLINFMMAEQKNKLMDTIAEAKRAQQEAILANTAKSSFLANMSHEIRTPINAILGLNEMILRKERNDEILNYASTIQTSGNLLLSIINDVLDISKIESGKIEVITSAYDIASLINDCCNMTSGKIKDKNLEFIIECSEDMPHMLQGDEPHLRQIIVNLLTNAAKYTEQGSVTLSVSGERIGEDSINLRISVKDTGIGISEEDIGKLFKQFTRVDIKHNRNIEGTGLGLTIVKHLVELMGGEITVQSTKDVGSEFCVVIPQKIEDNTPVGQLTLNVSHTDEYTYERRFEAPKARILAVDDLAVNLMVITNMLRDTKMTIDTATRGADAIELAEKNHYDLILMDHMMPDMDGVETFAKLRADEKTLCADTPVIMLTANALAGVREQYMYEGFADYLSKPVRGKKLEDMILKHLPPELVNTDIAAADDTAEAAPAPAENELTPLINELPQFNLNVALPYCCQSTEFLIEILRDYAASTRLEEMREQFEKEDFDGYRINAHSLKSTSLTVGLEGLSERARASEFALKCNNIEFVKMNHDDLMEMYSEALTKIRAFLADYR